MSDQPQVRLKRKVTLRRKEEAAFTFTGRLKVRLLWQSETDLDLCLFFRRKDGEVGGVFSDLFRSRKSDRGALDQFPYILHLGDSPEPGEGSESVEQINVGSLADLEQAYVCIVNYGAATDGRDVTFADESGRVEITSDAGDTVGDISCTCPVASTATEPGSVYLVCSILNRDGNYALKNESRVMDLSTAFNEVPGFSLICE